MPEEPLEEQIKSQRAFGEDLQRQIDNMKKQAEDLKKPISEEKFEDLFFKNIIKCNEIIAEKISGLTNIKYYLSSNQTITTETDTVIPFDTKVIDSLEEFDNTTNYRFTVQRNGIYLISAQARMLSLDDGKLIRLIIRKNGTASSNYLAVNENVSSTASSNPMVNVITTDSLVEGDYIDVAVFHTQGSNKALAGADEYTFLSINQLS